jgi:membrane peptidoglycan carboxypeptidase
VLTNAVADAVNDVLRGVQEPGGFGYGAGIALNMPSAGKTGTAENHQAVWFVGYTPKLATASMVAGANSEGSPISLDYQSIGGYVRTATAGSTTAGPVWGDAMKAIQQWLGYAEFVKPDRTEIKGVMTTVPSVAGLSIANAEATLRSAGFTTAVGPAVNSKYPAGTVAHTSPGGGTQAGSGTQVVISPSNGHKKKRDRGRGRGRGNGGGGGFFGGGDDD